ncbi:MAG: hypothetical protein JWO89_3464 [Verrucomicrobiaceae bacterium]|nr:hypothetical protein [Verrucomicrobiaceae bacterium]
MRRFHYNVGLVIAGVLAFAAYVIVGWSFPPDDEFEITVFDTFFQGIGYVFMMLLANVCFFLGPVSERYFKPVDVASYRRRNYARGFWFSVLLPFSIPALMIVKSVWTGKHT